MKKRLILSLIGALFCLFAADSSIAGENRYYKRKPFSKWQNTQFSISNNSGGNIVQFALRMSAMNRSNAKVRFTGRCDSACTMYLGLPQHKMCIAPGAHFRFHMPQARSARTTQLAKRFLYRKYPGWVRSWIASRGGLSRNLITMDYNYAKRFIKSC